MNCGFKIFFNRVTGKVDLNTRTLLKSHTNWYAMSKVALDQLITNVFDLVLMDIQMPVINGIDALKTLRELENLSGKHLTVIALSAYALIGDQEKFLKMGFDGYLKKPFTTRELVKELSRLVPG